jgi:CheY-like chemotaxis protein
MRRVLVVDDNFIDRRIILEILKGKAECDLAASGEETVIAYNLSIAEHKPYDIILLDISMSQLSGIEVLKLIRENELKAGVNLGDGIPIVMVTGYKEPFLDAFNGGCDDYILKPITAHGLVEKIENKLKMKRQEKRPT